MQRNSHVNRQMEMAGAENAYTYTEIFNRLYNIAINVIKWTGLPETVDARYLERGLFNKGYMLYFDEEYIGNLCLHCTLGGRRDVYQIPMVRTPYSAGYNFEPRDNSNSVLIYNNFIHTPTILTIQNYAYRLWDLRRTIDVNLRNQKNPKVLQCTEQQRLTFKNLYEQYDGNAPVIVADKEFQKETDEMSVIDLSVEYKADKLIIAYHNIWNEALTFLGVENSNQDKKERLVENEVSGNFGNIEAERKCMLNAREEAAEKINRMFGANIWPEFNSDLVSMLNRPNNFAKGGDSNGEIYDDGATNRRDIHSGNGGDDSRED